MENQTNQKKQQELTMEEIGARSLIYRACELVRNLESNFPNMAKHPHMLSLSIDEILKTLLDAKERLLRYSQHQTLLLPSSSPSQIMDTIAKTTSSSSIDDSIMQQYYWLMRTEQLSQMHEQLQLQTTTPFCVGGGSETDISVQVQQPPKRSEAMEASPSRPPKR